MSGDARSALARFGWDSRLASAFGSYGARGLQAARVLSEERGSYLITNGDVEFGASISGRLRNEVLAAEDFPAVGDWVVIDPIGDGRASIHAVLPRHGRFARPARGDIPGAQVIAANVDLALIVSALDHDFNLRRLERYLALAWSSGADPVVLLNKADVCSDVPGHLAGVRTIAPGVPVHALSARTRIGLDAVRPLLEPGRTVCLLGSSGVGKSTLVNALLGWERQATREVRADDQRGRHTTSRRELLLMPSGALLIDSPGMRSVGMWDAEVGIDTAFADIDELAAKCRFSDCRHEGEPGCRVQAAIASGGLSAGRLGNRRKLERELEALERRRSSGGRAEQRRRGRQMEKFVRGHMKAKYGRGAT